MMWLKVTQFGRSLVTCQCVTDWQNADNKSFTNR